MICLDDVVAPNTGFDLRTDFDHAIQIAAFDLGRFPARTIVAIEFSGTLPLLPSTNAVSSPFSDPRSSGRQTQVDGHQVIAFAKRRQMVSANNRHSASGRCAALVTPARFALSSSTSTCNW